MRFFPTTEAAERAGLRPCRRCDPAGVGVRHRHADAIERACRAIEGSPSPPALATLAADAGMSPSHFHRLFKAHTGVTPKAYAEANRAAAARRHLDAGGAVTDAIYAAGYESNGRFYATASERFGMTPSEYRKGAPDVAVRFAVARCRLGHVLVAATDRGVCAVELGNDAEALVASFQGRFHQAALVGDDEAFAELVAAVVALVEHPGSNHDLPLDIRGTAFQERVWRALRDIPAGETLTYGELATRLGMPGSARAVASACASNRLAVLIPCHRVVRRDGELAGYRWGVERKRRLLDRERAERGPENRA